MPSYSSTQKFDIATRHIIPKQLSEHALIPDYLQIQVCYLDYFPILLNLARCRSRYNRVIYSRSGCSSTRKSYRVRLSLGSR
jgi:hypothetical protein